MNIFTNEDCMEVMKRYPDKYFDLAIVDPPYGINYDCVQNKMADNKRLSNGGKWKQYKTTEWDKAVPDEKYFKELFRISNNQIVWGGNYYFLPSFCQWIIWNKIQRGYMTDGEMAWTSFKGAVKIFDYSRADAYINDIDIKIHPTQKPIALYKWLCKNYAKEGMKILDTHVGSASSLIAFEEFGLEYVGCELDPDYYKAAVERLEKHREQYKLFEAGFDK